jgi:hypothetical protein
MAKTLQEYAVLSKSSTFTQKANQFISGNGKVDFVDSGITHYEVNVQNGLVTGGRIVVNTNDVASLSRSAGISLDEAYIETITHELGHFTSAPNDIHANLSTAAARTSYCYLREGEASTFGFQVALENHQAGGNLGVAGVTGNPNLYSVLSASYNALSQTTTRNP